jgi:hypothetical protein
LERVLSWQSKEEVRATDKIVAVWWALTDIVNGAIRCSFGGYDKSKKRREGHEVVEGETCETSRTSDSTAARFVVGQSDVDGKHAKRKEGKMGIGLQLLPFARPGEEVLIRESSTSTLREGREKARAKVNEVTAGLHGGDDGV